MKKRSFSCLVLLVMSASCAGLFGCDEEKSDNSGIMALLAIATSQPVVVAITPSSGTTEYPVNGDILVRFSGSLDTAQKGTIYFASISGGGNFTLSDPATCTITFETTVIANDTVRFNPVSDFGNSTVFMDIWISGFSAAEGVAAKDYHDSDFYLLIQSCFVAGTLISTVDGFKPIEEIAPGELVYAYEFAGGKVVEAVVTETFASISNLIFRINAGGETIGVTGSHPFYVAGRGWIKAADLRAGDALVTRDGTTVVIDSISQDEGAVPVYNIEVEGVHNYFVTDLEILVHNK